MAAAIDVRAIANFSSIPESSVNILLENPTSELVKSLLQTIETRAKEHEQSKSQKVKLEVELETYVRTSESKTKVLQNSRDKALADVSKLRVELQNTENARSRTESQLEQLRQTTGTENVELERLKSRIASLEATNRDTLALLDSKTTACDRLAQELSSQHQKVVDLRKQVSSLEQLGQTSKSAASSAKFREQSLQQELDLQKKNNEWLENERKIKAEEHTTFRKEKNARISELARLNEQYIDEAETLKRSESALRTQLDGQVNKTEELLQQVQRLQEKEIADADNHRVELDSVNRLAELQKASADTAKQRVQELSVALDEAKEEAADEIGRIRAEVEQEHQDREAAEQRVAELEVRISDLESEVSQSRLQPSTPRREPNGMNSTTPNRPGTPTGIFSPASASRMKGNLTVSQVYGEYKKIEKELASERRLNEQLQNNVDSMLEDLESNKPEIEELRSDQTRLQSEVFEMSTLVEKANHDLDTAVKEARIVQGQLDAATKELNECQQTLRDRNSQLRWLLMEREIREQGGSLSEGQFEEVQRAAADADRRDTEHLSETQRIVNQQLVLFKSVEDLQSQNENQLVTIRRLVGQLESAEAREQEQQYRQSLEELEVARRQITSYQDEIKRMVAQSKSFVKERDTFRNMLTRRGHLPTQVAPADFSRSMPLPAGSPTQLVENGSMNGGESDYAKLLKDLQIHFDSYRRETATDTTSLKSQISDLSKRNAELQTDTSKAIGQLTAANQRYEMLQANFNMLKTENAEVQKRSYASMEAATKQELRVQQAAEELVESRGLLDGLRRESANLKAEKDLWKNVEKRLVEDIESLRNERGRLDNLNGSLQSILNEREQADGEARRRLKTQVESLESELQSSKRKLNEELEESKKTSLRREYEHEQSQKRIDDLVTSLGTTREELASAKTARDHLQARVDEMAVELRSASERLEILTRPPVEPEGQTSGATEDALSREQELSVEVSELRRDLELKSSELDRANEQIEVYKNIAQSSEERLQEISDTNDQFKEETENLLNEKDIKIKDLQQRIQDVNTELETTNTELSSLRDAQAESNRKLDEQKVAFEGEISRLKDAEENATEQAQFNLEASKIQAQIATDAQQNYENELLKHAEAAKHLHTLRTEANQLRLEMVDLKTQAETARSDLEQKESSWSDMKDRYEREVTDLKKRRDEVVQQNTLLHGQLEGLTQQIAALKRDRTALSESEAVEVTSDGSQELTNLQEVIRYLRREKEIVDVQYHLSTQEVKRLRQQLEFAQSALDDTRLKLDQQRRTDADTERNAMSHNKLMETLTELNLFRESSVTLRAEAKHASQALAEKVKKVEELQQQIQPLQARIAEMENHAELREGEVKLLQEDRDHWQQRCQNILSKYDRVDPAELESLKSKLAELETERNEAVAAQVELQVQVDSHPEQLKQAGQAMKERLAEQLKNRSKEWTGRIKELKTELETANNEKVILQGELESTKEQLHAAQGQVSEGAQQLAAPSEENTATRIASDVSSTPRIAELEAKVSELQDAITAKDEQIATKDQELATSTSLGDQKFKARENQMKELLNKRLKEVKQEAEAAKNSALEELREKLKEEHQQEIDALRAQSVPVANEVQQVPETQTEAVNTSIISENDTTVADASTSSATTFESLLGSLSEAQAKQIVQSNETVKNILRVNIRKSVEKERENHKQELEALRQELSTAQSSMVTSDEPSSRMQEMEQNFEAEKEKIIKQKEEEFELERTRIQNGFEENLKAEKQALASHKEQEMADLRSELSKDFELKLSEEVAKKEELAKKGAALKLNMAENRARLNLAKLDVVKKAADETPEKPVKEVWDVAKDVKAPPQQQQAKQIQPSMPKPQGVSATSNGTARAADAPAVASTQETNGISEAAADEVKTEPAQEPTDNQIPKPVQANTGTGPAVLKQPASNVPQPRGGFRGRGGGLGQGGHAQQNQGQNTNTTQQGQQQATRGSGIPRGRGGGPSRGAGGRAGAHNVQTSGIPPAAGRGQASPSRGGIAPNLNPNAQQFTPGGQKRGRDESDGAGDGGNLGKRIRGGGNVGGS